MEPMSALAISTAVLQFVDFGAKILSNATAIYKSRDGLPDNYIEIAQISRDLADLSRDVDATSRSLPGQVGGSNVSERIFRDLCNECQGISQELELNLSRIQINGTKRLARAKDSILSALKNASTGKRIDELLTRLGGIRQEMMMAMIVFIWKAATVNNQTVVQFTKQQEKLVETVGQANTTVREFSKTLTEIARCTTPQAQEQVRLISSHLWSSPLDLGFSAESLVSSGAPGDDSRTLEARTVEHIIQTLEFESITHRETAVSEAALETYNWVFGEPRDQLWSDFPAWLRGSSEKVYWVTGKPGSGKSTLMKYILKDPRMKQHLERWAGNVPLITNVFFSWNAGTDLQKSHEGLLRTLLCDCIQQRPKLVHTLFPKRRILFQLWGNNPISMPPLRIDELVDACKRLAAGSGDSYKLFTLIDGLDEFEEEEQNHSDLINLLRQLNHHSGIKICASSRPYNIFRDAFMQNPMLRLENLTRDDIQAYTARHFEESPGFRELRDLQPSQAVDLVNGVVTKAQGVFLWVSMVVRLLLRDLTEGDDLSDLQRTLGNLPQDLSMFFQKIWDRIDPKYHQEASHFFQIKEASRASGLILYAATLWFAEDKLASTGESRTGNHSRVWEPATAVPRLTRRLNSRTRGLLEIYEADDGARVDFLHRTARDWALENRNAILAASRSGYNAYLALLKGEATRIAPGSGITPCLRPREFSAYIGHILNCIYVINAQASPYEPEELVRALDCLEGGLIQLSHALRPGPPASHRKLFANPESLNRKFNLVGLVAQLPVDCYVKAKVQRDPRILWHQGLDTDAPSLLENLVFGGTKSYPSTIQIPGREESEENKLRRAELIKFIITNGEYRKELSREDVKRVRFRADVYGIMEGVLSVVPYKSLRTRRDDLDQVRTAHHQLWFSFTSEQGEEEEEEEEEEVEVEEIVIENLSPVTITPGRKEVKIWEQASVTPTRISRRKRFWLWITDIFCG
ncbi:hypothetical protein QBC47DRAFT_369400 [Echria macrotheca]|uniref:NACHT domain-containing protein n=1 Tax=Echria macrotheca TaxID=438768 RepID=A0AAJ0FGN3_9PEZI|nr:hypothetical protein QBC47DRAFT_369400 [Echria macrotheca]